MKKSVDIPEIKQAKRMIGICALGISLMIGTVIVSSCNNNSTDEPKEEVWEFNYNDGSTETLVCGGLHQATHYVYYVLEGDTYKTRIPYESLKNYKQIR